MNFKYRLTAELIEACSKLEEFSNGAAQVSVRTRDGSIYQKVLISNSSAIIAMRDMSELPFEILDISEIYQSEDDKNPKERGGWIYFDEWS